MKTRYERAVVWVERTPSGPFLCIKVAGKSLVRTNLANAGSLIIGARYKVLVGDTGAFHSTGITSTEPEPTE